MFSFVLVYSAVSVFVFSDDRFDRLYVNVMDEEKNGGEVAEEVYDEAVDEAVEEKMEAGEYAAAGLFGKKEKDIEEESPFKDLPDNHRAAPAVISLYHKGILSGYGDGTFNPDGNINRAEFVKLLIEAANVDFTEIDSGKLKDCFMDVRGITEQWFAPFVCSAKYKGWISGYGDGSFGSSRNINKVEGLKIIMDVFGFEIPENNSVVILPFPNVPHDAWYLGVLQAAKENGLIFSYGDEFNPGRELSRADVSLMIFAAMRAKGLL